MSWWSRIGLAALGVVAVAVVALVWWLAPMWTGPSIPDGAIRLEIATQAPGPVTGCATALLAPVRVTSVGDGLILVGVDTGARVRVRWPSGFAAWRTEGHAVLADGRGQVIAREGDVLDTLGGGLGRDDVFDICPLGIAPRAEGARPSIERRG